MKEEILDVLADRYASPQMVHIWSAWNKIILERKLWIAVMQAQRELGINIPKRAIDDYQNVKETIDLKSIAEREQITRHDIKARIQEFNALAGHEHIHKGMTSRDLTENVEQLQIRLSLLLVRNRIVTTLVRLADLANLYSNLPLTGRSHNVPAQVTTLGKRFANGIEEQLHSYHRIEELIASYPLRGIKGPVGTQQDMLDLFEGNIVNIAAIEFTLN